LDIAAAFLSKNAGAKYCLTLRARCTEIEAFALTLAEQVRDKRLSDEIAREQLAQKYPFLKQGLLDHTWSQAMYFSFK
jgi:hypothetical protein